MKILIKIIIVFIFYIYLPIEITHADVQKIAVVVNDEIISKYDIDERIKLITFSGSIKKDKELRNRILYLLIDEKIKIQESKKLGLSVSKKEIDRGINFIEKQNNMKKGDLNKILLEKMISLHTLTDQITAEISWQKVISNKIRPQINVSENELSEALKIKSNASKMEDYKVNLSQIIFEKIDLKTKKNLIDSIKEIKTCNKFENIGKKFGAKSSSNLGLIKINDTPDYIKNEVKNLKIGEISNLVITPNGNQIFMICDKEKINVDKQVNLIRQKIAREKLFNLSKKYLDKIKSDSIIDIR